MKPVSKLNRRRHRDPSGRSSRASCQVLPPSSETSTRLMPEPRSHATPRTVNPDRSTSPPSSGSAMIELTTSSVTGTVVSRRLRREGPLHREQAGAEPDAVASSSSLSSGTELISMLLRCFIQYVPTQPGRPAGPDSRSAAAAGRRSWRRRRSCRRPSPLRRECFCETAEPRQRRLVRAADHDLDRFGFDPRRLQHIAQPRAAPCRAAHGAVGPLHPGDVRDGEAAAVARALAHRQILDLTADRADRSSLQPDWVFDRRQRSERQSSMAGRRRHARDDSDVEAVVRGDGVGEHIVGVA